MSSNINTILQSMAGLYGGELPTPQSNNGKLLKYIAEEINLNNKSYELIEGITLTEDTESIYRDHEPNGTVYKFSKVLIKIHGYATNGVISTVVNLNENTQSYLGISTSVSQYTQATHEIINGVLRTLYHTSSVNELGQASAIHERNFDVQFIDTISSIKISASKLVRGTNIKIYAVRK